ncbi:NUDIX domain-containing protein [Marinibacterium profundimaris]|uniref:ADP-ribose pyrophosphatase n=1 Tax=Marinibacterium profundimaris TaxID=1679460 RepID=A0A225NBA9_9RHOB|nr:NUDIX domain-containing protein [Marinibacterium profundimaris]OWU67812.1 hypothetical protein ATO3_25625 [Marinibacterium profundimaris]
MAEIFLFGRLRHAPLLEIVLGRPVAALVRPARLPGHKPVLAGPRGPVTLIPDPGGAGAPGLLLGGLTDVEIERLHFYCAVHGAAPLDVTTDGGEATAFVTQAPEAPKDGAGDFDPDTWQAEGAPHAMLVAVEVMAQYGRWPAKDFGAHRLKAIETRAAARLRAPQRARPSRFDLDRDVELQARTLPYLNFFSVTEVNLRHRQFDGSMGPVINRAAIGVGDAAIVLPYDPVRDEVLLVQQFRAAPYIAGDTAPWTWEAPAGLVDPGESPETAAYREAEEEAKVRLSRLERVAGAYSSTGSSTEFSHIFVGIADLDGAGELGGLEAEGEDIHGEVMAFDAFFDDLQAGRFVNLQLVTAGLWLALNRERLRSGG